MNATRPRKRKKDKAATADSFAMGDFRELGKDRLSEMEAAGAEVVEVFRVLANTGDNVVGELLKGQGTFMEWDHYPKGDAHDFTSYSQYYYHAHPAEERPGEHGHFHTFLRPKGMPKGIKPAPVADFTMPKDEDDALSHIVGISMDSHGFPLRMFTTNRWVTGEIWYRAEDVCAMVECFVIDHAQPSWPVNRWVGAMLGLFRPQIEELLVRRDRTIAGWQKQDPATNVFEDRDREVTSVMEISVDEQIEKVARAQARV